MILELATVLALSGPQCPYLPIVDPPHGKLFCYIWTRLGNPPDRAYLRGVELGGFDATVPADRPNGVFPDHVGPGGASGFSCGSRTNNGGQEA